MLKPFKIGPFQIDKPLFLAPMAGVTDKPFRQLCKQLGAGVVVSEMTSANPALRKTQKSQLRLDHSGEASPKIVQIVGGDPQQLADAARFNVDQGAEIIDINMGCPAKKVCKKAAGSALLKDEKLVADLLTAVVNAVNVPVTLKIRTGWSPELRNGVQIAKIAQEQGIQALAVHGRTRACRFQGVAEYETIKAIKDAVTIPIIANGDIITPAQAVQVLKYTGVDGLMIGRGAQGQPWIFEQIQHYLDTGKQLPTLSNAEVRKILLRHLGNLYDFYGEFMGIRIARKHVGWYCKQNIPKLTAVFNSLTTVNKQISVINKYFLVS